MPIPVLAVALATPPLPLTLAEAEAMSPAQLGDRLLAAPHPPIVEKTTYPEGGPPPPPNAPVRSEIRLWDAAQVSREQGFCGKTRYTVFLAPVARLPDGSLPPAAPASITSAVTYRWNPGRGAASCEGHYHEFFSLRSEAEAERVFAAVRLLAEARDAARTGKPGFGGEMNDALGREVAELAAKRPDFRSSMQDNNPEALVPMNDWQSALARYPLDKIVNYYWPGQISPPTGDAPYRIAFNAAGFGAWMEATLLIDRGRIARLDIKRYMPPPF